MLSISGRRVEDFVKILSDCRHGNFHVHISSDHTIQLLDKGVSKIFSLRGKNEGPQIEAELPKTESGVWFLGRDKKPLPTS